VPHFTYCPQLKDIQHENELGDDTEAIDHGQVDVSLNGETETVVTSAEHISEDEERDELAAQPISPVPLPRRSMRERRPPKWHDSYHMNRVTVSDARTDQAEAIKQLVHAGVLNDMSICIVDKVIDAVIM